MIQENAVVELLQRKHTSAGRGTFVPNRNGKKHKIQIQGTAARSGIRDKPEVESSVVKEKLIARGGPRGKGKGVESPDPRGRLHPEPRRMEEKKKSAPSTGGRPNGRRGAGGRSQVSKPTQSRPVGGKSSLPRLKKQTSPSVTEKKGSLSWNGPTERKRNQ